MHVEAIYRFYSKEVRDITEESLTIQKRVQMLTMPYALCTESFSNQKAMQA